MLRMRLAIAVGGLFLPYVARIPGTLVHGMSWVRSYTSAGLGGFALIQSFNIVAWGTLFGLSFLARSPRAILLPTVAGLGFVGVAHAGVDLAADPQNPIALLFIPLYALPIILVTFVVSLAIVGRGGPTPQRSRWPSAATSPASSPDACPACGAHVNFGASHCKECDCPVPVRAED